MLQYWPLQSSVYQLPMIEIFHVQLIFFQILKQPLATLAPKAVLLSIHFNRDLKGGRWYRKATTIIGIRHLDNAPDFVQFWYQHTHPQTHVSMKLQHMSDKALIGNEEQGEREKPRQLWLIEILQSQWAETSHGRKMKINRFCVFKFDFNIELWLILDG